MNVNSYVGKSKESISGSRSKAYKKGMPLRYKQFVKTTKTNHTSRALSSNL